MTKLKAGDLVRRRDGEEMTNGEFIVELFAVTQTGRLHGFPVGWTGDLDVTSSKCTGTIQNAEAGEDFYVKVGERDPLAEAYEFQGEDGCAKMDEEDIVAAPSHYTRMPIQPKEFIVRNNLPWHVGNPLKYICRAGHKLYPGKDQVQSEIIDLEKAINNIQMRINVLNGETEV